MSENRAENPLGTAPIQKLIWKYSVPGIISQLINSLHNIVDQVFLGWGLNDLAVGATNVTFPFSTIMTAVSALIGMGAAANFSILLGRRQERDAADYLGNAVTLLLSLGLLIALISSVFLRPILYLFGATEPIMEYAYPYARILCLGVPFGIFSAGMAYFIRADGSPKYSSAVLMAGAVFNMVFDPIFLFVLNKGIAGVALATVLGQLLSALLAARYLLGRLRTVHLARSALWLRGRIFAGVFSLGFATFTTHVLATAVQIVQMNALKHYGALSVYGSEVAITASGAVNKLTIVFLSSVIGIAIGCQPIVGYNLGNEKYARVKQTYLLALRYGTIVAVVSYLLLQLFPDGLLKLFGSEDPMFFAFAGRYIRIYLAAMFLNALQPTTSIFCTALGKAKLGFWMAVIRQGLLMIPLTLLLPLALGLDGVLYAAAISDAAAAAVVIFIGSREVRALDRLQAQADGTGQ